MTFRSFGFSILCLVSLASCATNSPKRQAFPTLDQEIHRHAKAGKAVVYPKLVHSVKPEYPTQPANGSVWAVMHVSESGSVREVKTVGSTPVLYQEAIQKALLQWRFQPGTVDGRATAFPMQVKITFARQQNAQTIAAVEAQDALADVTGEPLGRIIFFDPSHPQLPKVPEAEAKLPGLATQREFDTLSRQIASYERQGRLTTLPGRPAISILPMPRPVQNAQLTLHLIINEKGRVEKVWIAGKDAAHFLNNIKTGLSFWQLAPVLVDGKPHRSVHTIRVRFKVR